MEINSIEELLKQNYVDFNNIENNLKQLKKSAVESDDQKEAKHIWCLEQILKVKKLFINSFNSMKNNDFEIAWYDLDRCDIELSFLKSHFNYTNNEFNLLFIENEIPKYQELFPYDLFSSRETIDSNFSCSICGGLQGIRNTCHHKIGEIYDGEMCYRIVGKMEPLGIAIVKTPFDKYTILKIKDIEYNYFLRESLMKCLNNPFEKWGYDIEVRQWDYKKTDLYKHVGRNDMCPCGSNLKFKKCCLKTHNPMNHYKIWGDNNNFLKNPINFNTFNTKKNKC